MAPGLVGSILNTGGLHTSLPQLWLKYVALERVHFPASLDLQNHRAILHIPQLLQLISRLILSFERRFFSSPFLLTFKISQRSSSLRSKCDFNTAIISLEALQPLTNVLSSTSHVLSTLSGGETHGAKMTQEAEMLEGPLWGRQRLGGLLPLWALTHPDSRLHRGSSGPPGHGQ